MSLEQQKRNPDMLQEGLLRPALHLDGPMQEAVEKELALWQRAGNTQRIWRKEGALWGVPQAGEWLGWLEAPQKARQRMGEWETLAREAAERGFSDVVVLGMGGSALGVEALKALCSPQRNLEILDTTVWPAIWALRERLDLRRTLFIVASKSGGTLEANALLDYFWKEITGIKEGGKAGEHFIAITDPGTSLAARAREKGFWEIYTGDPSIGGRYSLFSVFGMVPLAAAGGQLRALIAGGCQMADACKNPVSSQNPGVLTGVALGTGERGFGRYQVRIETSGRAKAFGGWLEQLLAESTGKQGRGLVPFWAERDLVESGKATAPAAQAQSFLLEISDDASPVPQTLRPVPGLGVEVRTVHQAGELFFMLEFATAVAGKIMGIDPFDQPDVESSKIQARELSRSFQEQGAAAFSEEPALRERDFALYEGAGKKVGTSAPSVRAFLGNWLGNLPQEDYLGLLLWLDRSPSNRRWAENLRRGLEERTGRATLVQFGPRFLHSTGQVYKGGTARGHFIQVMPSFPLGTDHDGSAGQKRFEMLAACQALGDFREMKRRVPGSLRLELGEADGQSLRDLATVLLEAADGAENAGAGVSREKAECG